MNMKRPLAFLLAAGMTLGLAACGGNGGTSGSGSSGSSGSAGGSAVTLDLWAFNIGGFTEASNWDTILAAFNEQHPDITVNVTPINYQDGDQKLTSAITSGSGPDIIFEGPERIVGNYAREGLMVDLSDLWTESGSDIAEGISSVSQLDGTYYMYPLSVAAHCMAINYEVFEQAGALQYLDQDTRTWTTDDFVAAMETIRDSGLTAVPGILYCGGQGGDQGTRALVNNLYSGTYTNPEHTEYTVNSPENVQALELLKSMVDNQSLNANAGFQASDELQQFANGTAAVTFCWNASNKAQYASQVTFTPYAMAFPSDDGVPELCGGIWGFGIFDSGDEARIEAAKTFIKFVCDDENQAAESVRLTGFFPVRESLGDVYEGTDQAENMGEFASLMPYLGDYYNVAPNWTEQRQNWFNMLQQIMVNNTPAQEAADAFVEASNP